MHERVSCAQSDQERIRIVTNLFQSFSELPEGDCTVRVEGGKVGGVVGDGSVDDRRRPGHGARLDAARRLRQRPRVSIVGAFYPT